MPDEQVFISYSHKDKDWLERLQTHLKPYLRDGSIKSWSDKQISPGSQWLTEIKTALTNTKVAVLLVTPDFIASDFVHEYELGPFLKEAKQGGVQILWVHVRASSYKKTALNDYQAVLDPAQPLANMRDAERDQAWVKICEEIEKAVNFLNETLPEQAPKPAPLKPVKWSLRYVIIPLVVCGGLVAIAVAVAILIHTFTPNPKKSYDALNPYINLLTHAIETLRQHPAADPASQEKQNDDIVHLDGAREDALRSISSGIAWDTSVPTWLPIAIGEVGQAELRGTQINPRIQEYIASAGGQSRPSEHIPWVSYFVNWTLAQVGIRGTNSGLAESWLQWGAPLEKPKLGCIAVFRLGNPPMIGGRVGFYLYETTTEVVCIVGNQANAVRVHATPREWLIGYRWPDNSEKPILRWGYGPRKSTN